MTKRRREESFKYKLLETLKDMGAMLDDYLESPYQFKRKLNRAILHSSSYRSVSNYYKAVNQLEKEGLVKKKKVGKYVTFKITEEGRAALRKRIKPDRRTDGFSTVIIFDIPEDKHGARNAFRRYLVRNGFMLMQKSVLIGPYKFSAEIKDLGRELGISQFITVLTAKVDRT